MSRIDEMQNITQEEPQVASPDAPVGEQEQTGGTLKKGDREAIEAIKKFTEEDYNADISIKSILGGDFLMSRFVMQQVLFVMFLVFLAIIYTGNRYSSQQDSIEIDSLRSRLQDVKYNVLTQSSELMNLMRQSNVEKALREMNDSTLQNAITPPYLIRTNEESKAQVSKAQVREVMVDSVKSTHEVQKAEAQPQKEAKAEEQKPEETKVEETKAEETQPNNTDRQ